jgi:two-component system response regulator WspF
MKLAIGSGFHDVIVHLENLLNLPNYEIIWNARNGLEVISKAQKNRPDLILLDLDIANNDVVATTKSLMNDFPCAILLLAVNKNNSTSKIFEALGNGALDSISLDLGKLENSLDRKNTLLSKITTLSKINSFDSNSIDNVCSKILATNVITFGSSTGGPAALEDIFSALPTDLNSAIVVIQHMDQQYSSELANWLNKQTPVKVRTAKEGDKLVKGVALIASTKDHLILKDNLTLSYTPNPLDYPFRPSINAFFSSLAKNWKKPGTAVLLTGMGKDGAEGLKLLRSKGWHTIAQDKNSSAIYGMPKAAADLNAAVEILPLNTIAQTIIKLDKKGASND